MESGRYLRKQKATRLPSRLVFWDTETKQVRLGKEESGIENVFRLGCASRIRLDKGKVSRRETLNFTDRQEWWNWLEAGCRKKTQTFVFAHNLCFDATVSGLWMELDSGRFRLSDQTSVLIRDDPRDETKSPWRGIFVRDDPPTIIKVRTANNATITFCDTLNWFKSSLEVLGERIGLSKMDMPEWESSNDEWFVYCMRDVEVIENTMINYIEWIRINDLGNFKLTAPSQAFGSFNHRFRKPNIVIHQKPEVQKLEREGYYGGRLESFYIGSVERESFDDDFTSDSGELDRRADAKRSCYLLDVNSLYPSVMREFTYPVQLESFRVSDNETHHTLDELCHRCIADVHLETDQTFPKRIPGRGICFVKGTFRTTLCGFELERALNANAVTHVYSYARYNLRPLFSDYVDFFWNERKKAKTSGDTVGDLFCKLFLNSLYGKFGQLTPKWVEWKASPPGEEWSIDEFYLPSEDRWCTRQNVAGVTYLSQDVSDHPNSFCAIAAFVTAYARERMNDLMLTAGKENVLYIVTDGIVVTPEGFERLEAAGELSETELGKLSVKSDCVRGHLGGIHWYQIGETVKQGSNKKKAVVLSTGHALQERWERLAGILKRGPTDTVRVTPQLKYYSRQYRKGIVEPNGDVTPFTLHEPFEPSMSDS